MRARTILTRRLLTMALALGLVAATPACASSSRADDTAPPPTAVTTAAPATSAPRTTSAALRLHGATTALTTPNDHAPIVSELAAETELGSTTTLLVLDARDDWLQVLLPIRPNGTTGWVRATAGDLRTTDYQLQVDLDDRRLELRDGGEVVLESDIAVGAPETPTPTGRFSVTDLVETGDPDGAYGPFAIGLSAHSDQLTEFAGGDGQVGVHGTNQADSIGAAVSHGCIRLPNEVVSQLVQLVPLGTPVMIR